MRPALDRLLSRPFSLHLLRYLTLTTPESASTHRRACKIRITHGRRHATCAAVPYNATDEDSGPSGESPITGTELGGAQTTEESVQLNTCDEEANPIPVESVQQLHIRKPLTRVGKTLEEPFFFKRVLQGKGSTREWTFDEIQFESALDQPNDTKRKRLVDQAAHRNDFELWAQLLAHRRRIYGLEGVGMIWYKMRDKNLQIPYDGHLGMLFWDSFIALGLRKRKVLHEIVCYLEDNEQSSQRLPGLYVRIIQHFALRSSRSDVEYWHQRLISRHPPSAERFKQMVRTIVYSKGDMEILQYLYEASEHRNAYAKVVPVLCAQERFEEALKWHHILISHLDLPRDAKAVESLQSYLEHYYPRKAIEFLQSLSDAGVSFMDPEPSPFMLSQNLTNPAHEETHGIKEKPFNDKLGARWFATTWISLDLAINSVHALGFREIGPLSLQSIAMREQLPSKITERIVQLRELEISIGDSIYSQAIETFARKQQHSLLRSLLESDQHPDALEDWKLQESLLGRYAAAGDWGQYRRTGAVRLIAYPSRTQEVNLLLREHLSRLNPNLESILNVLEEMRIRCLPVKPITSRYLIKKLLRPRRRAHRPIFLLKNPKNLDIVLSILHNLLKSGSYVPVDVWIEIIKRLGMEGRLEQLETLCLTLADWYSPQSATRRQSIFPHCRWSRDLQKFAIPAEIQSSHPKHPSSLLFPSVFQFVVVEWGFISYFRRFPKPFNAQNQADISTAPNPSTYPIGQHPCTQGIRLLNRLRNQGVTINRKAVRMAIIDRLIKYYSPNISNRWHNRIARKLNPFAFHELLEETEAAWRETSPSKRKRLFSEKETSELRQKIDHLARRRTVRERRKVERKMARRRGRRLEREKRLRLRSFNGGETVYFTP